MRSVLSFLKRHQNRLESSFLYLGAIFLMVYGIKAFWEISFDYDYLLYHLPHALALTKQSSYILGTPYKEIVDGYPPLAHWVQGILYALSGVVSFANAHNFMLFIFTSWVLKVRLKWSKSQCGVWLLACLSIPLISLHLSSGYIDLWVGCLVGMSFMFLYLFWSEKDGKDLAYCSAAAICACFSKMQAWPLIVFVGLSSFVAVVSNWKSLKPQNRNFAVLTLLVAIIGVTAWPLKNLFQHGSPFFPYPMPLGGKSELYALVEKEQTALAFMQTPKPLRFWLSYFELTRFFNKDSFMWSVDAFQPYRGVNINYRMGGFSWINSFFLTGTFVFLTVKRKLNIAFVITFILALMFISNVSQSHEMRYWLFIPILLIFFMVNFWNQFSVEFKAIGTAVLLVSFFFTQVHVFPRSFSFGGVEKRASENVKKFWSENHTGSESNPYILKGVPPEEAIFYSGPNLKEFWVERDFTDGTLIENFDFKNKMTEKKRGL